MVIIFQLQDTAMKYSLISLMLLILSVSCSNRQSQNEITPVSFTAVNLTDQFWKQRITTNQQVTIPHAFQMCENTGRIRNFEIAAGLKTGEYTGVYPFNDSDVYKVIEGSAYTLHAIPDPELAKYVDDLVDIIAAAQEDDGYLMTWRTINPQKAPSRWSGAAERWSDIRQGHELYCAGHLYEAAVAYFEATGKRKLLDVAIKNAELILREFGPGKIEEPPGHQEIEIGLVKLYTITRDRRYFELAHYFLEQRGRKEYDKSSQDMWKNGTYWQDHLPVAEQQEAGGHAVRATYMYAAMADIAMGTDKDIYRDPLKLLWRNVVEKKLHISGGVGAIGHGEAFGPQFDLPNLSAYNETCAAVGNVFWNHRMFLLDGHADYIDVLERTLFNGLISGISLEGNRFFYPNVLESKGHDQRSPWFRCACCPGNITRFMASFPGYLYATGKRAVYVNLYVQSEATIDIEHTKIGLRQATRYPWEGEVLIHLNLNQPAAFGVNLRIPGWARNSPVPGNLYKFLHQQPEKCPITINGEAVSYDIEKGYAVLHREWKNGDIIKISLPMKERRIITSEEVVYNLDRVAIQRGPLLYCAEGIDNGNGKIRQLVLADDTELTSRYHPDVLDGLVMISGRAKEISINGQDRMREAIHNINLIPYYAWAHRGKSHMAVWLARNTSAAVPLNTPPIATTARIAVSGGINQNVLNDQVFPKDDSSAKPKFCMLTADTSGNFWIEYSFGTQMELSAAGVYWVLDKSEALRKPESWKIFYNSNGKWQRVYSEQGYGTMNNEISLVEFETIRTNAIRLQAIPESGKNLGIYEFQVD